MVRGLVVGWWILSVVVSAGADEVVLKNADTISGTVASLEGGKLAIDTPYAGTVKIDWARVASIQTDAKVRMRLKTGEILEGKLSPGAEGRVRIETEGATQPVEVELGKITHLNEPPVAWHGTLSLSFRATDGNTHTTQGLVIGEGTRATANDLFFIRFTFRYGEDRGEIRERNGYGLGKYQYTFSGDLYGYASVEMLSDKFKDLRLGTVVSTGLGYPLLKEGWIDFAAEAGVAYFDSNFREAPDESHLGSRAHTRLRLTLPLGFEFKDLFTIYPNFEDSQDFQIRNEATLGTALGGGWELLGGGITEYDREPSLALRRHDNTYFIGLGYAF